MPLLVAAGALFRDAGGRVLLVKPHYKAGWDIPGGMVEPGETPSEACAREVTEAVQAEPTRSAAVRPLALRSGSAFRGGRRRAKRRTQRASGGPVDSH